MMVHVNRTIEGVLNQNFTFHYYRADEQEKRWRDDGKCGSSYLSDGSPVECDPYGEKPCCDIKSDCVISESHFCDAAGSIDYQKVQEWRLAGNNFSTTNFK